MEESLLMQILAVQKEILAAQRGMLAELRHLRLALTRGDAAPLPAPASVAPAAPLIPRTDPIVQGGPAVPAPQAPAATSPPAPAVQAGPQPVAPEPQPAPQPVLQTEPPVAARPTPPPVAQPDPQFTFQSEPEPAAAPVAPTPPVAPPAPEPRGGGMLTMDELADLGGQFLNTGQRTKSRVKPVDVADLGGALMDELKAKNRAKRDAFAEFDRLRRGR